MPSRESQNSGKLTSNEVDEIFEADDISSSQILKNTERHRLANNKAQAREEKTQNSSAIQRHPGTQNSVPEASSYTYKSDTETLVSDVQSTTEAKNDDNCNTETLDNSSGSIAQLRNEVDLDGVTKEINDLLNRHKESSQNSYDDSDTSLNNIQKTPKNTRSTK